ncbi:hypothetical protein HNQ36_002416 [Afipia massiliensis]|uniref:Uncharacterized protein n=1 Tax=Afipia massiliensis TaxID=211460 RepID=A0A840N0F1_9BRAD|nr:hypothetical protein [Afipia massiliensis]MBB5052442.1 hypothetical protein [Afipia massiliensis]
MAFIAGTQGADGKIASNRPFAAPHDTRDFLAGASRVARLPRNGKINRLPGNGKPFTAVDSVLADAKILRTGCAAPMNHSARLASRQNRSEIGTAYGAFLT